MFHIGKDKDITILIQKLLKDYTKTLEGMKKIDKTAKKSKMLSINSAIESNRLGSAGALWRICIIRILLRNMQYPTAVR